MFKSLKKANNRIKDVENLLGTIKTNLEVRKAQYESLQATTDKAERSLDEIAELFWGKDWAKNLKIVNLHGDIAIKLVKMKDNEIKNIMLAKSLDQNEHLLRVALKDPTLVTDELKKLKGDGKIDITGFGFMGPNGPVKLG